MTRKSMKQDESVDGHPRFLHKLAHSVSTQMDDSDPLVLVLGNIGSRSMRALLIAAAVLLLCQSCIRAEDKDVSLVSLFDLSNQKQPLFHIAVYPAAMKVDCCHHFCITLPVFTPSAEA